MAVELPENLKQSKPLSTTEEAVYLWILVTAEQLKAETVDLFKQRDLTAPQYNVLRILRGAGDAGLCGREIGDRMITRDSDITRMLDRLESRGLIRRERQTDDRRIVLAFISKAGLATLAELDKPIVAWHKNRLAHLSENEMKTLTRLLRKVLKDG
ncbi:MAG: MarR family transcriptional regulator [Blastocatellia bacterium]|nr:MarR family transcriptional regulator [Blastocatellia bacterium]